MQTKTPNQSDIQSDKILNTLGAYVWWKDTEGRYLGANQYALEMLGLTADELMGKTIFDVLPRDSAQQITLNDQEVLNTRQAKTFHETIVDAKGETKAYIIQKSPLYDDTRNIIGLVAVATDITHIDINDSQQKRLLMAKRSYIDGMAYFNDIATIFNDMASELQANIYWKDINGIYRGCNDALLDFVGTSRSEGIVGKTIYDFVKYEIASVIDANDRKIMQQGKPQTIEENGLNMQGEVCAYISHKVPVRNDAGEIIGLLGISFDITERRKMTEALVKAKQQAEAASRAKSDFIMNMSHDIRTPFVGILGFSEILEELEDDATKLEIIGYIRESSERLLGLLNEVIAVVNEDAAEQHINSAFNVRELIHNLQKLMLARVTLDKLTLNVTIEDDVPDVLMSDKQGINRVLLNLVGNAIKFTPQGSVSLMVSVGHPVGSDIKLILQVSDTGIGIPKDKQTEIFERYTRLSQSWRGGVRGSGLGLYFVKRIVDRLGGTIQLQSDEGKGSTFTIEIPCKVSKKVMSQ